MSSNIVVLGSVNIDLVVSGKALPRPGETVTGGQFFKAHGGKGANQAVAAKRLTSDADVTFIGAIGDDTFGTDARETLETEGINVSELRTTADTPTGVALIMVDGSGSGENLISVASGANAIVDRRFIEHVAADAFQSADIFLVSLEVGIDAVQCALERARQHGAFTILNPAPVKPSDRQRILSLLPLVDLLIPNELEAEALRNEAAYGNDGSTADSAPIIGSLADAIPHGAIIVTLGEEGCLLRNADGSEQSLPAHPAGGVVDTTGAGDCFCGAIAAELANATELGAACRFASRASGICVSRQGAQPSLPFRSDL